MDAVASLDRRQEQQALLYVWRQVQQVQDLRHTRLGDVSQAANAGLLSPG